MGNNLSKYSIEELEAALAAKKAELKRPALIRNPDVRRLVDVTEQYLDSLESEIECGNYDSIIASIALETIYGPNITDWIFRRV